jgi:hypothetical protein
MINRSLWRLCNAFLGTLKEMVKAKNYGAL